MRSSVLRPIPCIIQQSLSNNCIRTVAGDVAAKTSSQELKTWRKIPGPPQWPIVGQIPNFIPGGEFYNADTAKLGKILYDKYGPIVKIDGLFGMPPIILLYDADCVAQILRSENWMPVRPGFHSLDYYRRNYPRPIKSDQSGFGLLTDHGETWKEFRSTVNPVLLQPKTIKLYTTMIDEVALDMITRLKSLRDENYTIQSDFEMEMNLWSLESIALIALGRRLRCFDSNLPPDSPEKKLIQLVHDIFVTSDKLDFKPSLWRYYSTKSFKKAMKLYREQEEVAKYFIDKTIEEIQNRDEKKPDDQKGVLEKLLEINKDVAIIMASDVLFAGVDTTSNTITYTLYLLAKNQEKQDKLREEINSKSDTNEKTAYLKACIKESMRVMPVVSGNIRLSSKEYEMLGYSIPKGMHVSVMHQVMCLMEEHYPRPEEYLPERWLAKKGDPLYHRDVHPFVHQPFGFGVRSCIGRRIAELELETFLSRLIQNFKVEWFGAPMGVKQASLNYSTGPYNFIFKDV